MPSSGNIFIFLRLVFTKKTPPFFPLFIILIIFKIFDYSFPQSVAPDLLFMESDIILPNLNFTLSFSNKVYSSKTKTENLSKDALEKYQTDRGDPFPIW